MAKSAWLAGLVLLAIAPPLAPASYAQASATATLIVRAHGFRGRAGQAVIALYASPDSWLKIERAQRKVTLPIAGDTLETRFTDLPRGTYAVTVVHDANGNGKLDMRWFPWPRPKEGSGVSNDATGGPPRWRDARLELDGDKRIDITVRY